MARKIARFCLGVLATVVMANGLGAKPADPKALLKGLSESIAGSMARWKVPGMAVAIIQDGQIVWAEGFGWRDVENKLKVTPKTLFAIGSTSKAFTAATVGILVDEGKIDWDKPVREYLPRFKLWDDFATARMTPRDLLCHRSGLPRHDLMWYGSPLSREEILNRLAYLEPNRDFRTVFQYQNLMFLSAGYLVEKVSGTTWEDFTRRRILDPLGMTSTNFSVAAMRAADDHALPYGEKKDKIEVLPYRNIDAVGPAGSINSNVIDMANWVRLNLDEGLFGGKPIISGSAMAQIHSPQMVVQDPAVLLLHGFPELFYPSYGMGWFLTSYRGHTLLHHGGNIDGFSALVSYMPRDKTGLVILTNLNGTVLPYVVMFDIYDRLLRLDKGGWEKRFKDVLDKMKAEAEKNQKEADKDRRPNTTPSHPLEDYVGDYAHPAYGNLAVIKDGSALKVNYNSRDFVLEHYHYDVFEMKETPASDVPAVKGTFGMDIKGNVMTLSLPLEASVKDIVFGRKPDKGMTERSFLEKLCGAYELQGQVLTVQLKGESALNIQVAGQPSIELVPYRGTQFNLKDLPGYSLEFKLDGAGVATEVTLSQPGGTYTAKKK